MENFGRVKGQDLGLATLQSRTQTGKTKSHAQRDQRKWKVQSPRGLSEVEEINREEVSNKMMCTLERLMRAYPAVWCDSSVEHRLAEIADAQHSTSEKTEAAERVQSIIKWILAPMTQILEAEQRAMMEERELATHKILEGSQALKKVQEERDQALLKLEQERDTSMRQQALCASVLQDLEELAKALEENKLAAQEAERELALREKRIEDMLLEQRDLVHRLVCGGPEGFVKWAREEIKMNSLPKLDRELEQVWWPTTRCQDLVEEKLLIAPNLECSSSSRNYEELGEWESAIQIKRGDNGGSTLLTSTMAFSLKLLSLVVSEVFQQTVESYGRLKSPLSLPSAIIGFWFGLAGRMTYLAVINFFPQVIQTNSGISSQDKKFPHQ